MQALAEARQRGEELIRVSRRLTSEVQLPTEARRSLGKLQAASFSSERGVQAEAGRGCPKAYQLLTGAAPTGLSRLLCPLVAMQRA